MPGQLPDPQEVRPDRRDRVGIRELDDDVAAVGHSGGDGDHAEGSEEGRFHISEQRRSRRKVEHEPVALALDTQCAGGARERHGREVSVLHHDVRGGERAVPAQGELGRRREPAYGERLVTRARDEDRRRYPEPHRDALHLRSARLVAEEHDDGRVAGAGSFGESCSGEMLHRVTVPAAHGCAGTVVTTAAICSGALSPSSRTRQPPPP